MTVYAAPRPRAWRARPRCRWRALTGFCQDQEPLCLAQVEPKVHVPARLEGRNDLFGHRDLGAIARVSSRARVPLLDREHAKAAQFNPISPRQCSRDRVQNGVDDGLHVPLVQVRVLLGDPLNQFRLDHAGFRSRDRAGSSYRVLPNPISNIRQEATVLDGIGFTVPDSGESRLGRVPAQPARLRFSRKSSAPEGAVINRWPASGARTMAARLGPPSGTRAVGFQG